MFKTVVVFRAGLATLVYRCDNATMKNNVLRLLRHTKIHSENLSVTVTGDHLFNSIQFNSFSTCTLMVIPTICVVCPALLATLCLAKANCVLLYTVRLYLFAQLQILQQYAVLIIFVCSERKCGFCTYIFPFLLSL